MPNVHYYSNSKFSYNYAHFIITQQKDPRQDP